MLDEGDQAKRTGAEANSKPPSSVDQNNQPSRFLHSPLPALDAVHIPIPLLRLLVDVDEGLDNKVDVPNPAQILHQVERFIQDEGLPYTPAEKLGVSGTVVSDIIESFYQYSQSVFDDLDSIGSQTGPLMQLSDFDRYVRQYMELDFDRWMDNSTWIAYPISSNIHNDSIEIDVSQFSVIQVVDKTQLLEALEQEPELNEVHIQLELPFAKLLSAPSLESESSPLAIAHGEEIEAWATKLRQQLAYPVEQLSLFEASKTSLLNHAAGVVSLNLQQVAQKTQLSLPQLWLGLLLGDLGDYHLCGRNTSVPEAFYHPVVYCTTLNLE